MDKDILKFAFTNYGFLSDNLKTVTCGELAFLIGETFSLFVAQNAAVYSALMRHEKEILINLI